MTEQAYHARGAGRAAALEEVRLMLEEQRKDCLEAVKHTDLNAIRADELDTALINLRALAAEPGADTGTTLRGTPTRFHDAGCDIGLCLSSCGCWCHNSEWAGTYRPKASPKAAAERGTTPPEGLSEVAFEEVRVMLEEQKTECLADPRYKGLNRMRADELDNALINLRAPAATQRAPVEQGPTSGAEINARYGHKPDCCFGLKNSGFCNCGKGFAPDHAWEGALRELRASGWMVAVHNDYRQDGKLKTFWLFVKGGRAIKGEGDTDAEALTQVAALADGKEGGE